jgi:hypothetical protein
MRLNVFRFCAGHRQGEARQDEVIAIGRGGRDKLASWSRWTLRTATERYWASTQGTAVKIDATNT